VFPVDTDARHAAAGVEESVFAGLLAVTGAAVTPTSDERRPSDAKALGERPEKKQQGEGAGTQGDANTPGGDPMGAAVPDAPMTIRSLNRKLLQEAGGRAGAAPEAGGPGVTAGERDGGAEGRGAEGAGRARGASREAVGEGRSVNADASPTAKASVSPGTSELHPPATAGREGAAAASANTHAPVGASPVAALRALAGGAAGNLAVAVRSQAGAGARVVTAGAAPANAGGVGSSAPTAQLPRGLGKVARGMHTPAPGAAAEAKAEVFRAQVARGIAAALEKGNGTLTMRLKPEALGQLNVKVSMKEGVLTAQFQAQTREARDLLLSTAADLRRALEAVGVTVERIEATVAPDASAANSGDGGTEGDAAGGEWRGTEQDGTRGGAGGDSGEREGRTPERGGRVGEDAEHALDDGTTDWITLGLDTIA
jgi:hypothetical protein